MLVKSLPLRYLWTTESEHHEDLLHIRWVLQSVQVLQLGEHSRKINQVVVLHTSAPKQIEMRLKYNLKFAYVLTMW